MTVRFVGRRYSPFQEYIDFESFAYMILMQIGDRRESMKNKQVHVNESR